MPWTESKFPDKLDLFPRLIDGIFPVVPDDFDSIANAYWRTEMVLGKAPRGANSSVSNRIDQFMRADGSPANCFVLTSTIDLAAFSTFGPGATFVFPYNLPSTDYVAIISSLVQSFDESLSRWRPIGVDGAWIITKSIGSVVFQSYGTAGNTIGLGNSESLIVGVLVVHRTFTEGS